MPVCLAHIVVTVFLPDSCSCHVCNGYNGGGRITIYISICKLLYQSNDEAWLNYASATVDDICKLG